MHRVNVQDTTTRRRKDENFHRILTTRKEALSLYREIVRITALFDWPNEQGIPWCECIIIPRLSLIAFYSAYKTCATLLNSGGMYCERAPGNSLRRRDTRATQKW